MFELVCAKLMTYISITPPNRCSPVSLNGFLLYYSVIRRTHHSRIPFVFTHTHTHSASGRSWQGDVHRQEWNGRRGWRTGQFHRVRHLERRQCVRRDQVTRRLLFPTAFHYLSQAD